MKTHFAQKNQTKYQMNKTRGETNESHAEVGAQTLYAMSAIYLRLLHFSSTILLS